MLMSCDRLVMMLLLVHRRLSSCKLMRSVVPLRPRHTPMFPTTFSTGLHPRSLHGLECKVILLLQLLAAEARTTDEKVCFQKFLAEPKSNESSQLIL